MLRVLSFFIIFFPFGVCVAEPFNSPSRNELDNVKTKNNAIFSEVVSNLPNVAIIFISLSTFSAYWVEYGIFTLPISASVAPQIILDQVYDFPFQNIIPF